MESSELRIGNLVKYKKGHLAKVTGVSSNYEVSTGKLIVNKEVINVVGVESNYIDGIYESHNFYPVDLTYNLINKIDFKELEKDCRTFFVKDKFKIEMSNGGNFYYGKIFIPYVHSLQNLYFALTGVELTLNEL